MSRVVTAVVLAAVAIAAVVVLRNTAMTVHEEMPADSRLEVEATARWRGEHETAPRLARALAIQCVAETSATAHVDDFAWHGGRFSFVVGPALDEPDRRQLHGCLSDLRMPRLIVAVDEMRVA